MQEQEAYANRNPNFVPNFRHPNNNYVVNTNIQT